MSTSITTSPTGPIAYESGAVRHSERTVNIVIDALWEARQHLAAIVRDGISGSAYGDLTDMERQALEAEIHRFSDIRRDLVEGR